MTIFFLFLFSIANAQPHYVTVEFWLSRNMSTKYFDDFLIVYLQNKTYKSGSMDYTYKCYHANYTGGLVNITVPETEYFDLLFTNGAVTWNGTNGCPSMVENYEVWATVQSNIYVDRNLDLDYYINITRSGEPRGIFWNTQSFKAILSIITLLIIVVIAVGVAYITKSGIACLLVFLVGLAIKLILGI